MDNAKKMILIEPEVIDKLKNGNSNTSINNISHLDKEMNKVINAKLEDREKWILYLQTLQRYLYFIDKDRKSIEIPIIHQDKLDDKEIKVDKHIKEETDLKPTAETKVVSHKADEEKISSNEDHYIKSQLINLLPKTYKVKGELLIDFLLKNKNKISWDDKGTVYINKKKISESNIVDLLNDVIRPLKNSSPNGWVEFSTALKDLKVPLSYIGNAKRATYIKVISKSTNIDKETESSEDPKNSSSSTPEYSTPVLKQVLNKEKPKKRIDWEKWTPY